MEGSQYLRILCYEKCYDKSMLNKDDNEIVDKIMGKGQVQVRDEPKLDRVKALIFFFLHFDPDFLHHEVGLQWCYVMKLVPIIQVTYMK